MEQDKPNGSGGSFVTRRSNSAVEFRVAVRRGREEVLSAGFCPSFRGRLIGRLKLLPVVGVFTPLVDGWLAPGNRFEVIAGDEEADGDCLIPLTVPFGVKEGGGRFIFGCCDVGLDIAVAMMGGIAGRIVLFNPCRDKETGARKAASTQPAIYFYSPPPLLLNYKLSRSDPDSKI